jgi:hypothetical protein
MIGLTLARKKWLDLNNFAIGDAYAIMGRALAGSSKDLAEYVRLHKLSGQSLEAPTGETRGSVKPHRMTKRYGIVPAYVVRPGVGIKGSLNYLAGVARGYAVAKSGKQFFYKRPRPFIAEAWKEWGGARKVRKNSEAVLDRYLKELETRTPETETVEIKG